MRGDIAPRESLQKLTLAEYAMKKALRERPLEQMDNKITRLDTCIAEVMPRPRFASFAEHVEILVVAVAVAMACREYFFQPFKIPTGSMQPTLYGIHSEVRTGPSLFDRMPLKLAKWLVRGEWYSEVTARTDGVLDGPVDLGDSPYKGYYLGGLLYKVPKDADIPFETGQTVRKGDRLWAGVQISGDHVFVNRTGWILHRPVRSDVVVFLTNGIEGLRNNWNRHYIKRCVGLPGETISIAPPQVLIDGKPVEDGMVGVISRAEPPYVGYRYAETGYGGIPLDAFIARPTDKCKIGDKSYFCMGDNTRQSHDSRYWGPVNQGNMVGPATFVYWPYSERWGRIRR
jgi:signal peptidase I